MAEPYLEMKGSPGGPGAPGNQNKKALLIEKLCGKITEHLTRESLGATYPRETFSFTQCGVVDRVMGYN